MPCLFWSGAPHLRTVVCSFCGRGLLAETKTASVGSRRLIVTVSIKHTDHSRDVIEPGYWECVLGIFATPRCQPTTSLRRDEQRMAARTVDREATSGG